MDSSRFKEIGYATSLIPMTLDKESLGYLVKLNCIWLTFQYYFKAFGIKPPKGKAFHKVVRCGCNILLIYNIHLTDTIFFHNFFS